LEENHKKQLERIRYHLRSIRNLILLLGLFYLIAWFIYTIGTAPAYWWDEENKIKISNLLQPDSNDKVA
jgi:hypothetical protein